MDSKRFLFLQGPHGPFFRELATEIEKEGADVMRIAFNSGDAHYWNHQLTEFQEPHENWPEFFTDFIKTNKITDIVLYGESRPIHRVACEIARKNGVMTHLFEEGYLRPYWVSYERQGVNGNSPLMQMSVPDIIEKRRKQNVHLDPAPASWGNAWHHNWYGFTYHFHLWMGRKKFPNYSPHRSVSLFTEWRLNAWRLFIGPYRIAERDMDTWRFLRKKPSYFVAILQLEHDASLQTHSDYKSQNNFIQEAIEAFSKQENKNDFLVFKLHPFEDGRAPIPKWVKHWAKEYGVQKRVKVFFGGKLGTLLDQAKAGLTINSTASQQVLWRDLPLKIMGRSIFSKPEFASNQDLSSFFASPTKPDHKAFLEYRSYLLETSQYPGGYYAKASRKELLSHIVSAIASPTHPYDKF